MATEDHPIYLRANKIEKAAEEIFAARLWDRRFAKEIRQRWKDLPERRKDRYRRAAIWAIQAYLGE